MRSPSRSKRFTLMPLIALAGLSLFVTIPAFSATQIHAAKPVAYTGLTVRSGDSLWTIAAQHTASGGDVQAVIDQITAVNHLASPGLTPGQHLRIPR